MSGRAVVACVCVCACLLGALAAEAQPDRQMQAERHDGQPRLYRARHSRQLAAYPQHVEEAGWGGIPPEALLDILPFPKHLVLLLVGAAKWVASHASLLILGAVLTVGTCTLTPFCHISVERFEQLEGLPAEYYRAVRSIDAARRKYGG